MTVKITKISNLALWKLAWGAKGRNKARLEALAEHNRRLTPPDDIAAELGLDRGDLNFLNALGKLPGTWQPYVFSEQALGDPARLAAKGLLMIRCKKREISLSDAGRFLLVLAFFPMQDKHEDFQPHSLS